jgi:GNAT superfamily N-acetyltransferase
MAQRRTKRILPGSIRPGEYLRLLDDHPHRRSILQSPRTVFTFMGPRPTLRRAMLFNIRKSELEYADKPNAFESGTHYIRDFPSRDQHVEFLLDSLSPTKVDAQRVLIMISHEETGADPIGYAVADCAIHDTARFIHVTFELKMLYVIPAFRSQGYGILLIHLLQSVISSIYDHIKSQSNFPGIVNLLTGTLCGITYNQFSTSIYERLSHAFSDNVLHKNFALNIHPIGSHAAM